MIVDQLQSSLLLHEHNFTRNMSIEGQALKVGVVAHRGRVDVEEVAILDEEGVEVDPGIEK